MYRKKIETTKQLRAALECIRFAPSCVDMGWDWTITQAVAMPDEGDRLAGWLIATTFQRPDTDTGRIGRGTARPMWIQKGTSFDAVIKTAWVAAKLVVDHELMEAFLVRLRSTPRRLFDPHASVPQLLSIGRGYSLPKKKKKK